MSSRLPIFRSQALEYYVRNREKNILPRLARPPGFLFLWILISLAGIALLIAWFGQIPEYISVSGLVVDQSIAQNKQPVHQSIALIFVPVTLVRIWHLRAGTPVRLQIGTQVRPFTTTVDMVEPGVFGPAEVQKRYAPGSRLSSLITGPSMVVSIKLGPAFASQAYAGSSITAQIQVGSTSVLSSLFGSAQAVGV